MPTFFDMGTKLNTVFDGANRAISTVNSVSYSANNIANTFNNLGDITSINGALGAINSVAGNVGNIINDISSLSDFGSSIRSRNLPFGGMPVYSTEASSASFSGGNKDWRVRLTVPNIFLNSGGNILTPLRNSDSQLIFPYTPTITLSGSANYDDQAVTHQNYQFIYFNSGKSEQIQIVAPFNVEDSEQALYWRAAVHLLRASIKMFSGGDYAAGNPPPIMRLNGYGNHVFDNIPVVVKQFSFDLPQDVNYINAGGESWVPVKSTLNLTLQPIYSRTAAKNFSLNQFVSGGYVGRGYV